MNYIENTYVCLAAPMLIAIISLRKEGQRSLFFVLMGMTACLLSAYISSFIAGVMGLELSAAVYELSPVVEEIMKAMPVLFYLLVYEPDKRSAVTCTLMLAVGFATFENICYLTAFGSADLLRLVIRGFSTGAMHIVCGMAVALGLFFLWDQVWLQVVGGFALLCFVITFHAIFNVFVSQTGVIFWVGSLIPLTLVLVYHLFFRKRVVLV